MGQNNLIVMKKENFGNQTNIYNPCELLRLEFKIPVIVQMESYRIINTDF